MRCRCHLNIVSNYQMTYELAADTWGPEEKSAIEDVVASGRLTMGPKVAEYEAWQSAQGSQAVVDTPTHE